MRDCETILLALEAALKTLSDVSVSRNKAIPDEVHRDGELILWDGTGEEIEFVMGAPRPYLITWTASLQVLVEEKRDSRDGAFDALCKLVGNVIVANRTLGGLCDWLDAAPPTVMEKEIQGAPGFKGGEIAVTFTYATSNPTG